MLSFRQSHNPSVSLSMSSVVCCCRSSTNFAVWVLHTLLWLKQFSFVSCALFLWEIKRLRKIAPFFCFFLWDTARQTVCRYSAIRSPWAFVCVCVCVTVCVFFIRLIQRRGRWVLVLTYDLLNLRTFLMTGLSSITQMLPYLRKSFPQKFPENGSELKKKVL